MELSTDRQHGVVAIADDMLTGACDPMTSASAHGDGSASRRRAGEWGTGAMSDRNAFRIVEPIMQRPSQPHMNSATYFLAILPTCQPYHTQANIKDDLRGGVLELKVNYEMLHPRCDHW